MVKSTIFNGKPEPLGISAGQSQKYATQYKTLREISPRMMVKIENSYANFFFGQNITLKICMHIFRIYIIRHSIG